MFMECLFTDGFKIVKGRTGIHGMEEEADIFGHVTDIIVFGIIQPRKEHGGISRGIIIPGHVKRGILK